MSWDQSDIWADEKARKAITECKLATFKFYVPNICDPDKPDIYGNTCLHEAAIRLQPAFVEYLLSAEVDAYVLAVNKQGLTPLQAAKLAWAENPELPTREEYENYGKVLTFLRQAEMLSVRQVPESLLSWIAKSVKRTFGADISG